MATSATTFRLEAGHLRAAGSVALPVGSRPACVRIVDDGRAAVVLGAGSGRLYRLTHRGEQWSRDARGLAVGRGGPSMALSPDGRTP